MTENRKRNKGTFVRMTEDEHEKYIKLVKKSKLSQQNYNLKCLLNKDIIVVDGVLNLAEELRKIGNNVNQIAHLCNTINNVNKSDVEELQSDIAKCRRLMIEFLKKVNEGKI